MSADGQHFLILEYISGKPIDEHARARSASIRERVMLVRQLLAAVAHAHAHQIVHRDLKPSNVLVTDDGVVARSLRKRPQDRYADAAEFDDALARWLMTSSR